MLIFHQRRYVLNLNNTDILPLRLFVPIIAEISNCQTKPIFILWNKCLLTCFLGDIFWQIWSRNLFTPCWPLIFYAPPLPPHCPRVHLHTLQFFRSSCFLFAPFYTFVQEYFPLQAPFQNLILLWLGFVHDRAQMQDMQRDPRKLHIGEHPNSVSLPLSVTPRTPTGDPLPPNDLVTQPPCSLSCHDMAWPSR